MKKIAIACDHYKAEKFRKRFQEKKFNVTVDVSKGTLHHFTIEVEEKDFNSTCNELNSVLQQLEVELKHSN